MRLLYFVQYFPPEKASGLPIVTDMIEGFAEHGWDVHVYIPTPTRGVADKVRKEYAKKRKEVLCNGKLIIHRMHLYREGTRMLQRTIRYSFFSLQCLVRGLFLPADAIFTGGGPPTQGIIGGLIHKWTKKKFIFNPQDLFPESLIIAGQATETSKVVKLGRKMERFAYKNADVIITITEDMAENIRSKITDKEKVHVVRNWIDTEKTVPVERDKNSLFDEFGLDRDKFYVVYAGNIGMVQGIETIVESAERLKDEDNIKFIIFGNGSEEANIKRMVLDKGLKNLQIFPLQPLERVSEVYSLGDVSIVPCKPGTGIAGMPSKTWTIMAAGTAIIGSFDTGGELDKTLREADCGYCVEAGNAEKLAEAIRQLRDNPDEAMRLGHNARKYAEENAGKEKAVGQYIKIIGDTVK